MPFIACLNNVKTTHKKTTPAHPPIKEADQPCATQKETRPRTRTHTTSTHCNINSLQYQLVAMNSLNYSQPAHDPNRGQPAAKMLASTMQISNNNPTNTLDHHTGSLEQRENQNNQPPQAADPSGPNSVPDPIPHQRRAMSNQPNQQEASQPAIDDSTSEHHHARQDIRPASGRVLLRKEVIQPHLPVRLPCYDFVPIASPTFDGSLHKGWATGFGCCRLS